MTGLDHVSIAGPDLSLGPVLVHDVEPAGLNNAHVSDLAAIRANDRLHALRPLPTRFECHAGMGFELGIAPALGLRQSKRLRPIDRVALAADHLLYGVVISEPRRPREVR
jgi:hypothetical protein